MTGSSLSSQLHSVPDCQAIVKKAIVERLKAKYRLSWFPETGSLHQVRFRILKDQVSVMVDTSGEGPAQAGLPGPVQRGPIKDTCRQPVPAEPPAPRRPFDRPLLRLGHLAGGGRPAGPAHRPRAAALFHRAGLGECPPIPVAPRARPCPRSGAPGDRFSAQGFDIDPAAVELTLENARKAGVEEYISASVRDIRAFSQEGRYGCVICNPPYGERLLDVRQAQQLYQSMGNLFRPQRGWSFGIITPDPEFEALFGRKADKRRKLYNGMIQCQYYQYFRGGKKAVTLLQRLRGEMETPRLLLRHWREEDYQDFLAFASDPQVMLASGARPARTQEEGERFFRRALWDSGCYAIVLKETGHPIGKIKFQRDIRRSGGEEPFHRLRAGQTLLGPGIYDRGPAGHGAVRV